MPSRLYCIKLHTNTNALILKKLGFIKQNLNINANQILLGKAFISTLSKLYQAKFRTDVNQILSDKALH